MRTFCKFYVMPYGYTVYRKKNIDIDIDYCDV